MVTMDPPYSVARGKEEGFVPLQDEERPVMFWPGEAAHRLKAAGIGSAPTLTDLLSGRRQEDLAERPKHVTVVGSHPQGTDSWSEGCGRHSLIQDIPVNRSTLHTWLFQRLSPSSSHAARQSSQYGGLVSLFKP